MMSGFYPATNSLEEGISFVPFFLQVAVQRPGAPDVPESRVRADERRHTPPRAERRTSPVLPKATRVGGFEQVFQKVIEPGPGTSKIDGNEQQLLARRLVRAAEPRCLSSPKVQAPDPAGIVCRGI